MTHRIAIIDNYDSFVFNLDYMLREEGCITVVYRNNEVDLEELNEFDGILLSPGPGIPDEAGLLKQIIQRYYQEKSMIGVCLGHQAIAEVMGGRLIQLQEVLHGVQSVIKDVEKNSQLYKSIQFPLQVCHYHSWVVDINCFPNDLLISARHQNGHIMSMEHKYLPVYGVQYHPESYGTMQGKQIIKNWLSTVSPL